MNQPGLEAGDNTPANSGSPPDSTGAAGPDFYVEFVNSKVGVFNKTTLARIGSAADLDNFIGAAGDNVFDPQIEWDEQGQRWIYLAVDCASVTCVGTNFLAYGFSKSTDPSNLSNGWCNYFIRIDNKGGTFLLDDYPKLGHNANHLIFGTNVFDLVDFVSSRIWTVPKPAPGTITTCPAQPAAHYFSGSAAAPIRDAASLASAPLRTADGDLAFTPVPANTMDSSGNGYVVASDRSNGVAGQIMIWHVAGASGSPALTGDGNVDVGGYAVPANVAQPGTSDQLDSLDGRLTQAVAAPDPDAGGAEAVWTQHTVDGGLGRSVARWYELLPATKQVRQEGTVADPQGSVFNAAISPTMAGNEAAISYNVGSSTQLVQLRYSSRTSSLALGSMHGEVTLGSSDGIDQDFTCPSADPTSPSCRWGDYAGATPDPGSNAGDNHRVWGTNQLLGAPSGAEPSWTTRNFTVVPVAWPVASFSSNPSPAFRGGPVRFDGSGSVDPDGGGIASFEWDFGDGSPHANGSVATHTFAQPGSFQVRLTVTDADQGLTDVLTRTLIVNPSGPTAAFTATPATTSRGQTVTFDGSASRDAENPGGIASYAWDFNGDGLTDRTTSDPTVTTSYAALGSFAAGLVVTDSDEGLTSPRASATVVVQNLPPVARLSFSPSRPVAGGLVRLSAKGSSDRDGSVLRYKWDLNGDGRFERDTGTRASTAKRFSKAGRFKVAVQVQDADAAVATAVSRVRVGAVRLRLAFPGKLRLAALLANGLNGSAGCGRACRVTLTLRIPAALARKLHTQAVVGRTVVVVKRTPPQRVHLRLSAKARRALAGAPAFVLSARGTRPFSRPVTARVRIRP